MRPIKFRGRYLSGEATVYGDLIHTKHGVFIATAPGGCIEVDPDSVAQLVGYDKNGKEVYEGDTVIAPDRYEWIALFDCSALSDDGFIHLIPLEVFTLKEDDQ